MMENELKHLLRARYPEVARASEFVDYLAEYGSPLWALGYGELFWPTFVEIDGMVFWSGTMRSSTEVQRVHDALETSGDLSQIEISFNFIEVGEFFVNDPDDVSAEALDHLTHSLCESWSARLESSFPGSGSWWSSCHGTTKPARRSASSSIRPRLVDARGRTSKFLAPEALAGDLRYTAPSTVGRQRIPHADRSHPAQAAERSTQTAGR